MELERQKILIDIDDTFLKSSEEIIRQLNCKNNSNKTIDDLIDYGYRSIDENITQNDIDTMYASKEFFDNVAFNDDAINFLIKYSKKFDIVFVSYGTEENLMRKVMMLTDLMLYHNLENIYLVGCEDGKVSKSDVLLDHVYLAIDNHSGHLSCYNSPKKILLKNYKNVDWNQPAINDEDTYIVNSFAEIDEMIEFDLKLKNMGVFLDA
jgi:5'(3')-deoxyribonucleotidase